MDDSIKVYSITPMCAYELVRDFYRIIEPGCTRQDVRLRGLAFEEILRKRFDGANIIVVPPVEKDFIKFKEIGVTVLLDLVGKLLLYIDMLRDGYPLLGSLITEYQKILGVFVKWQGESSTML